MQVASGGSAPGPGNPVRSRNSFLPEHQVQLCSMFLNVTHIVKKQLQETDFTPSKSAAPLSRFVRQCLNRRLAFLATRIEIGLEIVFRIGPFRQRTVCVLLNQREGGRGCKAFLRAGQVEVEPEQGMIDDIPELGILRPPGGVIPQTLAPQFVGTGAERIAEHVDSGPELLPDDRFPGDVHVETLLIGLTGWRNASGTPAFVPTPDSRPPDC